MEIILVGINHKTAPLELREKLSASCAEDTLQPLSELMRLDGIREAFFLSTCNRFEILANAADGEKAVAGIKSFMTARGSGPFSGQEIEKSLYVYRGDDAVRHLFRVASSLDSMVMGEPQILGQIKDAYRRATEEKAVGPILNKLMHRSFRVAKRVRTETGIAENAVSVSYAAVELAKKIFGSLEGKEILLVGAGEMTELAARHLSARGVGRIFVANRTFENAVKLAEEVHGTPTGFDRLGEVLGEVDIVISSTGSPSYLITREMTAAALHRRRNRLMFMIDIAVPRDIDPAVGEIDNVYLYNIDDLQEVVDENVKTRMAEAEKAEEIIIEEAARFSGWFNSLEIVPTIVSLRRKLEEIVAGELERSSWIRELGPEQQENVRVLAASILNKVLHDPVTGLKEETNGGDGTAYVEAIRRLFKLDQDE